MKFSFSVGAAAVALTLVMAACTPLPDPTPEPTTTTSEPETPEFTAPEWPTLARVSPAGVPGLDTLSIIDHDAQVHAIVPQLAGHEQFNSHLRQWAEEIVANFVDEYGATSDEDPPAEPWLSASWGATAVSDHVVGIVLDTSLSPGASTMRAQQVIWYSPESGEILDWHDFLTEEAHEELPEAVVAGLKASSEAIKRGDIDVEALTVLLEDDDRSVGFSPTGGLVVTFDDYSILAGSYGSPAVEFSGEQTSNWLTEEGLLAQVASVEPDAAAVPEEPVVPEPEEVDCEEVDCVALTFDDGPAASTTPELLKVLDEHDAVATFFMIGSQVQSFPQIVVDVAEAGHEIASHTWSHPSLPKVGEEAARKQLQRTNEVLEEVAGVDVTLMRPPYGATDGTVSAVAKAEGVAQILWNIDTRDWDHHDPKKAIEAAAKAKPGGIILMHDIHPETIEAVPEVIKELRDQGYVLVTVSNLLGETKPGAVYRSR